MIDSHKFRDHRFEAARESNHAQCKGWDFSAAVDQAPAWIRVLELLFRPSTLFAGLLLGLSVFLLVRF